MAFVNMRTVFSDQKQRGFDELARLYCEKSFLKEIITHVVSGWLDDKDVFGKKVLFKPNWVRHDCASDDQYCLRTNASFVLAALEVFLEKRPKQVTIGDAPIQGCVWEKFVDNDFLRETNFLQEKFGVPIEVVDFRRTIFNSEQNCLEQNRVPLNEFLIFDLGSASFLDEISNNKPIFRVTNYDPDRLALAHTIGMHKYCITKRLFESDLVISLPKIKTHQKTGITGALKNLVGLNGDKDFLPHHRVGGSAAGGDCYPGKNFFRSLAEEFLDHANRHLGKPQYWFFLFLAKIFWKLSFPNEYQHLAAGWYGNDTCWRMVMDLNQIALHGNLHGSLSTKPERKIYSLCDGIIGGQGNGPLEPEPLPLGIVSFTDHSLMNDICMATLMKFDYSKISLLRNAHLKSGHEKVSLYLNGQEIELNSLSKIAIKTTPPPGWVGYI